MKSNSQRTLGVIILVIGTALLLKEFGVVVPSWVFSWPVILIAIGVVVGVKHGFSNTASLVLLGIGGYFLLKANDLLPSDMEKYLVPGGLILLGIFLLVRKNKGADWEGNYEGLERKPRIGKSAQQPSDRSDYLNVEAVFCTIKQKSVSSSFQGGKITAIFGGTDIDLSQAGLEGQAVLDLSVVMGGLRLIVPPDWEVLFNVSNIAGGVEEKRAPQHAGINSEKKLVLTGSVVFGGVEVRRG